MTQIPKIGTDQFWEAIRKSELLSASEFLQAQQSYQSRESGVDSEAIAIWLIKETILTELQTEVFLAGQFGPFDFGRYRVLEKAAGPNVWLARDRMSNHLVWLHFFEGHSQDDLPRWDAIEAVAEKCRSIDHPNLVQIYECVVNRSHRFVATEVVGCDSLATKMPIKRRLTESQSLEIIYQVATAISELESNGIRHGSLALHHVFPNLKMGITKVLLPLTHAETECERSDAISLGRMLFRLLTGRDAPESEKISKAGMKRFLTTLSTRDVSEEVSTLIFDAVTADDSFTAQQFLRRVVEVSGNDSVTKTNRKPSATEAVFLSRLSPWVTPKPTVADSLPELNATKCEGAAAAPLRRTKQWPVAASLGASLFGFAVLLGTIALVANLKKLDPPRPTVAKLEKTETTNLAVETVAANETEAKRKTLAELLATQSYIQEIIADDQQTLWESPTTGFPIDVSSLPPSPRMIAAINWQSIHESESGLRTIKSLGPRVDSTLRQLESRMGFPFAAVESTTISFHSNLTFEYESFVLVELSQPVPLHQCLQNWQQPSPILGIENAFEKTLGDAWWIKETDPKSGSVLSFAVGPFELVQQVAKGEVAAISGTLRKMVASSDSDRDVNLLLPVVSLFNTEGQKLFFDHRKWMNELRLMLPAAVRGVSVSLHHADGDYIEFRIDHTTDLKPSEAATAMNQRIESTLEQSQRTLRQRQALPYWEPVRARFGAMLRDLSGQLRWGSEFGEVVGNAWLPPGAMHNFFAATELAIAFEPQKANVAKSTESKTPKTLEELLATRRDLNIANPPDLNVLLRDIREEISDQYLDLPFEFNIRLAGTDLQKDGITQNQRPGPLEISNQSVADILTQVMVSANPNRDIAGASDPNCKLVWVVTEDADSSGKKFVLITTRTAAGQNGYVLPEVFRVQP